MSAKTELPPEQPTAVSAPSPSLSSQTWFRVGRYIATRAVILGLTAVVGIYLTILAANLGGAVDTIRRNQISEAIIMGSSASAPEMQGLSDEEQLALVQQRIEAAYEAAGLNDPLLMRSFRALGQALRLDFGESQSIRTLQPLGGGQDRQISQLIRERIPATLLLFGVTNLVTFLLALAVSSSTRRYGGWADKLIVWLAPTSVAPSWFYGIFLIAIFAAWLGWLPFGGMRPSPPPESTLAYGLGVARHLILPLTAVFLSAFFQTVYIWRTYFLIHANEDYVEMAKAKGLSKRLIGRRYILRPTLPPILTSFALIAISAWSGSIILETLFAWPGLGELFYLGIIRFDQGVVIALTVIYAYFLAATVLLLDIVYVLIDPRLTIGGGAQAGKNKRAQGQFARFFHRLGQWRPRWPRWQGGWDGLRRFGTDTAVGSWRVIREVSHYPSAWIGLTILFAFALISLYTFRNIPYEQAVLDLRGDSSTYDLPRAAWPAWVNYFTPRQLPPSLTLDSAHDHDQVEIREQPLGNSNERLILFPIPFPYDAFPQEITLDFYVNGVVERAPHISMTWYTPDGREINLGQFSVGSDQRHYLDQDSRLMRRLDNVLPQQALFADPAAPDLRPLHGEYLLELSAVLFEPETEFDAKLIVHGQVYGLAGTDYRRRDLSVPLLWGLPTGLGFGITAALLSSLGMLLFAGTAAWFGGWLDELIQRLGDVNLMIPLFPILAMITLFYQLSIWYLLAATAVLSIFGSNLKTYRALFLQVKQAGYVQAAEAYGASSLRVVFLYLMPRVLPVLIPQLVILIPSFIFLEASIAIVGLSDPNIPTWGKVINDAYRGGALSNGYYHWILLPTFLLFLTSLAFALLGFALERVFNPRLD